MSIDIVAASILRSQRAQEIKKAQEELERARRLGGLPDDAAPSVPPDPGRGRTLPPAARAVTKRFAAQSRPVPSVLLLLELQSKRGT